MTETRTEQRRGFDVQVRLALLERDNDVFEESVKGLRGTMRWLISAHLAVVVSIIGALVILAFK